MLRFITVKYSVVLKVRAIEKQLHGKEADNSLKNLKV